MLAIVFAIVTLPNSDPDPVVTPSSAISQRLPGQSSPTGLQSTGDSAGFGNLTVTAGCTYGTPQLGPSFASDLADASRALTTPACSNATAPTGLLAMPAFGPIYSFSNASLTKSYANTGLQLDSAGHTPVADNATFTIPSRSGSGPRILEHLALPTEFKASSGPATITAHATTPRSDAAVRRPSTTTH